MKVRMLITFLRTTCTEGISVYRVNWLRAKSRRDRWAEEQVLLRSELSWTFNFFRNRADLWRRRATDSRAGHRCHALRQAKTWDRFATYARSAVASIGVE